MYQVSQGQGHRDGSLQHEASSGGSGILLEVPSQPTWTQKAHDLLQPLRAHHAFATKLSFQELPLGGELEPRAPGCAERGTPAWRLHFLQPKVNITVRNTP